MPLHDGGMLHFRDPDYHRSRDHLVDLLAESDFIRDRLAEERAQRVADRQRLCDQIAEARARITEQLPGLERTARTAYERMTSQLAKLRQAENEYVSAVRALSDLQVQTDRVIGQAERELERTSDEAIAEFDGLCEQRFDEIRHLPIAEDIPPKIDPKTGLKIPGTGARSRRSQQKIVEALDLIRVLQRRARAMRHEAIPDVSAAIEALRAELPKVADFR